MKRIRAFFAKVMKSRTLWLGHLVGLLALLIEQSSLVREVFKDNASVVLLGVTVLIYIARTITTKPLAEK